MCWRVTQNLAKIEKNENPKSYETRNFSKDLESQIKNGNWKMTSNGEDGSIFLIRVFGAKIQKNYLWQEEQAIKKQKIVCTYW